MQFAVYLGGLGGFAKAALACCLGVLVLAATSGCGENAQPGTDNGETPEAKMPVSGPAIDRQLASKFTHLAPDDWRLRRVAEASAQYDVELASEPGAEPVLARAAILLDGRFETYLSPFIFSPSVIAREQEKMGPVPPEYPVVEGFETVVAPESRGFDTKRGVQVRLIKYFNRDHGVFCRGRSPGMLMCLWGDPDGRLVLDFHSDHTVAALEYVKQMVFED